MPEYQNIKITTPKWFYADRGLINRRLASLSRFGASLRIVENNEWLHGKGWGKNKRFVRKLKLVTSPFLLS